MPSRRPVRLFLAVLLTVLFGAVSVAHAGAHLGCPASAHSVASADAFDGGMGCALCQNAPALQVTPLLFQASEAFQAPVTQFASALVAPPEAGGPSSRGPPV